MVLKNTLTPEVMAGMINPPRNMSLKEIGDICHVSRQRVHQILKEYKASFPQLFVEKKEPTKEELQQLLDQNESLSSIASKYEITTGRLKKIMDGFGIKKTFVKDNLTKEVLTELYVHKEWSDTKIAETYNCSANTVMKLRYTYGIYEAMRKSLLEQLPKTLFVELYINQGLRLAQIAELFNTNIQGIMAVKKEYNIDSEFFGKYGTKYRAVGVSATQLENIKQSLLKEVI